MHSIFGAVDSGHTALRSVQIWVGAVVGVGIRSVASIQSVPPQAANRNRAAAAKEGQRVDRKNNKRLKRHKKTQTMRRYHITVLRYYRNSDTTHQEVIECDGMEACQRGDYMFWRHAEGGRTYAVAHYPIAYTLITKIEYPEE